ncbi:hypothetical protein Mco01_25180 [Microbispora corallina]|uniref:ABC3 transporter permease C-terminal domain-containing protein n=1 Tax=Microbispora corallina TaxID=83302 RepID=A0ABQ4FXI3_9ACTN|nr:FtsX-like permease family protein [Microbispora corallina]GIH39518.1 hypothetical protein Mco01_25180 [Microbispora corallina]
MPFTLLRAHRGTAAVLAVLAFSAALLLAALPRAFERAYDGALGRVLAGGGADLTDLTVELRAHPLDPPLTDPGQFAAFDARVRKALPPALRTVVVPGGTGHHGAWTYGTPVTGRVGERMWTGQFFDLAWLTGADRRVRYVEGAAPGPAGHVTLGGRDVVRYDVGVIREAASMMGLRVGTTLLLGPKGALAARVTGFYELTDPKDPFWDHNRGVTHVDVRHVGTSDQFWVTALTGPDALRFLKPDLDLRYTWVLGVDRTALTAGTAGDAAAAVDRYDRLLAGWSSGHSSYTLHTSLPLMLGGFLKQLATAGTLVLVVLGGLVLVAVGVVALAARLLTDRMAPALSLMRARGGGLARVAATGAAVAALAAVPAALLGYAAAFLVPGPLTPAAVLGPPVPALAAVAYPAVRLALTLRRPLRERRADVAARPSPRRVVAEVTVVVLALAGAYLLRTRGLADPSSGRADPFLMAVPAALTVAAALVTLRLYPYPLRLALRLAGRRRVVAFLGLARASGGGTAAPLPVLVLLPALAVAVFGSVVSGAIGETQQAAAWRQVGASARIEAETDIPPAAAARVRALPGVEEVLPVAEGVTHIGPGYRAVRVVAVDLAAYRRMTGGTPLTVPAPPDGTSGSAVPALVSPSLAGLGTFEIGWPVRRTVVARGTVGGLPGLAPAADEIVVVPYSVATRTGTAPFATMLLVRGDASRAALTAAVDTPQTLVVTVADAFGSITGGPMTGVVLAAFAVVTAALAAYALVAVVLALVAGAADRARALAYLRTLGLSRRQARGLTVVEIAPLIVLASLAGLLLGLALPAAVAPGVDLSPYAGQPVEGFPITVGTPALLAGGLAAAAVLGALAYATAGRAVTGVLRLGESA